MVFAGELERKNAAFPIKISGVSSGGPGAPVFGVRKEEMTEWKKGQQGK